jgi:hypothetical protein
VKVNVWARQGESWHQTGGGTGGMRLGSQAERRRQASRHARQVTSRDRTITSPPAHDRTRMKLLTALEQHGYIAPGPQTGRRTLLCSRGASVVESVNPRRSASCSATNGRPRLRDNPQLVGRSNVYPAIWACDVQSDRQGTARSAR